jgi:hypothetical protein
MTDRRSDLHTDDPNDLPAVIARLDTERKTGNLRALKAAAADLAQARGRAPKRLALVHRAVVACWCDDVSESLLSLTTGLSVGEIRRVVAQSIASEAAEQAHASHYDDVVL